MFITIIGLLHISNVLLFRGLSVNEDYEHKIGLCTRPSTIIEWLINLMVLI